MKRQGYHRLVSARTRTRFVLRVLSTKQFSYSVPVSGILHEKFWSSTHSCNEGTAALVRHNSVRTTAMTRRSSAFGVATVAMTNAGKL